MGQEPVGLSKVPSFLVSNKSEVVCKFCGSGMSSFEEMVEHWKEEGSRQGLVEMERGVEKVAHAEVVMVAREEKEVEENSDVGKNQESDKNSLEIKKLQRDKLHEMEMEIDPSHLLVEEARVEARSENLWTEVIEIGQAVKAEADERGELDQDFGGREPDQELLEEVELVTVLNELKNECFETWEGVTIKRGFLKSEPCENNLELTDIATDGGDASLVGKIMCDMCDYASDTRGAFQKHTLRNHGGIKHTENMEIDGKFDPNKDSLTHKGRKGKLYRCSECDYSNDAKSTFLSHKYKMHGLETPNQNLMCHMCDYRTYVPGQLRNHTEAKHDGRTFSCSQCDFKSPYQNSLVVHNKIHDEENWQQCDLCTFRCATNGNLKTHMDGKHREVLMKSYPCPDCEATFKTSPARSIHKAAVHLKIRHKCDGCDYSHHSKQVVKKHFSAQHSNAIFSCPHCSFTSNWLAELQKHSRGQVLESNCLSIKTKNLFQGSSGIPCGPLPPYPGRSCLVEIRPHVQFCPAPLDIQTV